MNTQSLIIELPAQVLPPTFQLFESVRVLHRDRPATIISMRYISALTALKEGLGEWGWSYGVSYVYGLSPEDALTAPEEEFDLSDSDLKALVPTTSPRTEEVSYAVD
ncbi:hypothetical protein [Leptolyngbya sp. FACHB-16]|uniref:hypothetical protein n=1 Tax=unclassified Leptolyngbya TaxID=2650499 RepID=UPI00168639A6|nr:hypothetical protein [Leptolyngbya sp. FACHB-16]MBD2153154.1 hypothetical protein [Leptolyngbya sp. FACHB-16]